MEKMSERFPFVTQAVAELGLLMVSLCSTMQTLMAVHGYGEFSGETIIDILEELEHKLSMEKPNGKHPRHGIPTRN